MSDSLNSVEIQKIVVNPLGEWSFLIKKQKPQECSWPTSSTILCWWCCHSFSNVPAFLPVSVNMDVEKGEGHAIFTGNFCSWNCVKRYARLLDERGKLPSGCFYIGLLAFLTVCKGNPCEGGEIHEMGLCDCIETYQGVKPVPSREVLASFGGSLTIDAYRQGFHVITDHDKVARFFGDLQTVANVKEKALGSKNCKFWGFKYLHYQGPDASYTTHVNILPLTNRTFNKKTLVRTGIEYLEHVHKLSGPSRAADEPKPPPRTTQPRARRISRRGGGSTAANHQPLPTPTLPSTTDTDTHKTQGSLPPTIIMTQEQSLACNEEQQFYTNSLRGFGNILDSMGIEVKRKV
jgi:hypothetical protein